MCSVVPAWQEVKNILFKFQSRHFRLVMTTPSVPSLFFVDPVRERLVLLSTAKEKSALLKSLSFYGDGEGAERRNRRGEEKLLARPDPARRAEMHWRCFKGVWFTVESLTLVSAWLHPEVVLSSGNSWRSWLKRVQGKVRRFLAVCAESHEGMMSITMLLREVKKYYIIILVFNGALFFIRLLCKTVQYPGIKALITSLHTCWCLQ